MVFCSLISGIKSGVGVSRKELKNEKSGIERRYSKM
jgi:hypothetical protein